MKLDNLIALTRAKLLNTPTISSFLDVCFEAKDIKRGDLFFAYENTQIAEAVENGAYVVIFSGEVNISDSEIAWLKVESLDMALKSLARFMVIDKELDYYEANEIELKLAQNLSTTPSFSAISGTPKDIFLKLNQLESKSIVLCLQKDSYIFPSAKELPLAKEHSIIIEQTLFETSFIYRDNFYERVLISPLFMSYLDNILDFLDTKNIPYKLKNFTNLGHFEAIFVNNNLEVKNFGSSQKVLIFEQDTTLFENQLEFLKQNAPWAKSVFVLPASMSKKDEHIYTYESKSEILDILKKESFHFALIIGCDKSILESSLPSQKQLTFEF